MHFAYEPMKDQNKQASVDGSGENTVMKEASGPRGSKGGQGLFPRGRVIDDGLGVF